jgi:hypothetical protein
LGLAAAGIWGFGTVSFACTYAVPSVAPVTGADASDAGARPDQTSGDGDADASVRLPDAAPEDGPRESSASMPDALEDAGDAGADTSAGPLTCGPITCPSPQYCCATTETTGSFAFSCVNAGASCSAANETPITCDTARDCAPGELCCATRASASDTKYMMVSCAATCDTPAVPLCGDQGACPTGDTCQASVILPGFYACSP